MQTTSFIAKLVVVICGVVVFLGGANAQPPQGIDVNVLNFPDEFNIGGSVNVENFPQTQNVQGSISVDNFPATQNVQGTVNVGNFPEELSVQVTNLPGATDMPVNAECNLQEVAYSGAIWPLWSCDIDVSSWMAQGRVVLTNISATYFTPPENSIDPTFPPASIDFRVDAARSDFGRLMSIWPDVVTVDEANSGHEWRNIQESVDLELPETTMIVRLLTNRRLTEPSSASRLAIAGKILLAN